MNEEQESLNKKKCLLLNGNITSTVAVGAELSNLDPFYQY